MVTAEAVRKPTRRDADGRARRWLTAGLTSTVAGFGLGIGFVLVQGVFAPLSDLAMVASASSLLPVAWYLHRVQSEEDATGSTVAAGLGTTGLALVAASGLGLAVADTTGATIDLPLLAIQHAGFGLQGAWMVGVGALGLRRATFRAVTSRGALAGGAGYLAGSIVNYTLGFEHPLFYAAFAVALGGFLTWAVCLRTDLDDRSNERRGS